MRGQNSAKVPVKNASRIATVGAGSGGGNVIASPLNSLAKNKGKSSDKSVGCIGCGIIIAENVSALQCDRCKGAEVWKCIDCLNISKYAYDALFGCKEMYWICPTCEPVILAVADGRDDKLVSLMERLIEKFSVMEQQLHDKADKSGLTVLEQRVTDMESKLVTTDIDNRISALETRIMAQEEASAKSGLHADSGIAPPVVSDAEERECEARKNNVIIYRLSEVDSDEAEDHKCGDMVWVYELCNEVLKVALNEGDFEKMYRLGRRESGKTRPLLIKFMNEKKLELFKQLRELKAVQVQGY
jgi:hypothetical protein